MGSCLFGRAYDPRALVGSPLTPTSDFLGGAANGALVLVLPPRRKAIAGHTSRARLQVCAQLDPAALVAGVGKAVWGKGLPPGALVQVARETWTTIWKVMMSQLAPSSSSGAYQRPASAFRDTISPDHPAFVPESGRYALYAALSCPWAHRALIVHQLKGLDGVVPLVIARPGDSGLWEFAWDGRDGTGPAPRGGAQDSDGSSISPDGAVLTPTADAVNSCRTLKEVYRLQEGGYDGRATVPMLWDTKCRRPVNNESADIIRILNSQFDSWAANPALDLSPGALASEMDSWDSEIYDNVNNGVYCCGFATSQSAYDAAVSRLFQTLDKIDAHLASSRFLCGDALTLSDVRLFTTLIRFDVAYHTIFKCSRQKIAEFDNLSGYMREIYQTDRVAQTCDVAGVGRSYFGSLFPLNPGGIVPACPRSSLPSSLTKPHGRGSLRSKPGPVPASA